MFKGKWIVHYILLWSQNPSNPRSAELIEPEKILKLTVKKSKTDKLSNGIIIQIGCSFTKVCSYCTMSDFLRERKAGKWSTNDPLFADNYGLILTKNRFVDTTRLLLAGAGIDPSRYSGHSSRAGSTTTAGNLNFEDHEIKILGRWTSDAYQLYLRNPKLASTFARRLTAE